MVSELVYFFLMLSLLPAPFHHGPYLRICSPIHFPPSFLSLFLHPSPLLLLQHLRRQPKHPPPPIPHPPPQPPPWLGGSRRPQRRCTLPRPFPLRPCAPRTVRIHSARAAAPGVCLRVGGLAFLRLGRVVCGLCVLLVLRAAAAVAVVPEEEEEEEGEGAQEREGRGDVALLGLIVVGGSCICRCNDEYTYMRGCLSV